MTIIFKQVYAGAFRTVVGGMFTPPPPRVLVSRKNNRSVGKIICSVGKFLKIKAFFFTSLVFWITQSKNLQTDTSLPQNEQLWNAPESMYLRYSILSMNKNYISKLSKNAS